ncbi:MAG: hypothetical protein WCW04_01030 [Candidatus Paceibacterota bacterium]
MIPYSKIDSKLIKPYNLYTYTSDAKQYFINRFRDEQSFNFLHYLIRYSNEKNEGNWPDKITPEIIEHMSKDAKVSIQIEEMNAFKDGYVIKSESNYEITHEFVVASFMCCSDGNFLPLSTGHIDFTKTEKLTKFLKEDLFIEESQALIFLVELVKSMSEKKGVLMGREFNLMDLLKITRANDLIADLCINWGEAYNLLINDYENDLFTCNGLIFSAYYAMPRLS